MAHGIPDPHELETDVCVVGAGPAGLSVARELAGSGLAVTVLESGGRGSPAAFRDLNEGLVVGDAYGGLAATRHRGLGGTTLVWNTPIGGAIGGKYAPLDPEDFADWPFDRSHLEPFYRRAQVVCGLGPFDYHAARWVDARHPCLPRLGDALTSQVYQFGEAPPARGPAVAADVAIRTGVTVRRLVMEAARAIAAEAVTVEGRSLLVRARAFVLAGGAIENARILLVSGPSEAEAPGNRSGWVGRGFMEHPRDRSLALLLLDPRVAGELAFFDRYRAADGTVVGGRLAVAPGFRAREGLPNAYLSLLPRPGRKGLAARLPSALRAILAPAGWAAPEGYGWSRSPGRRRIEAFEVLMNLEQRPHPDNRITLGRDRDALGIPRPVLHWRWREAEQAALERLTGAAAAALEATGLFRVEVRTGLRPDPNAHHHAGTTRLAADPSDGVADPDGRIHGADNLFVTGASVFPTAGAANPTLTIVAMALRLADHLRHRFAPARP